MTFFPTYQETIRELRPEIRNKDRGTTQPVFCKLVNKGLRKYASYTLGAYPGTVKIYSSTITVEKGSKKVFFNEVKVLIRGQ